MASKDLKQMVAARVALGTRTGELAERFGYTSRGMRKLIASPEVQRLVAAERETLADRLDHYRAELVGLGGRAIENVRRAIEDPRHPRNTETSRWLLDRIAFGRVDTPQAEINVAILSPEAIRILNERLPALTASCVGASTRPIEEDPHLHRASPPR